MASKASAEAALPPAVLLMGPTAAGKTALAMALYDHLPVRLISVDSAQVYRGMDVGSAKPDAATLAHYPHKLIDIRDPQQTYSAADFAQDAEQAMRQAAADQCLPVLVGGTSLYFQALLYGLDPLPVADAAVRARLAERAERIGWAGLHRELAERDPASAARIRPSDPQRIQRALEVLELSGRSLSELQSGSRQPRFDSLRIVLTPGQRSVLHARIGERVQHMLAGGLIAEVEGLLRELPGARQLTALRSVGYRQVLDCLAGEFGLGELPARIEAATRQLAKRQLTSFRKFSRTLWYDPHQAKAMLMVSGEIARFLQRTRIT